MPSEHRSRRRVITTGRTSLTQLLKTKPVASVGREAVTPRRRVGPPGRTPCPDPARTPAPPADDEPPVGGSARWKVTELAERLWDYRAREEEGDDAGMPLTYRRDRAPNHLMHRSQLLGRLSPMKRSPCPPVRRARRSAQEGAA